MFKRFSTNYTALLFLLDMVLIQIALQAAMKLRFVLPFGISLDPAWPEGWVYYPSPGLHTTAAVMWSISFLIASVYSPRKIIFCVDEIHQVHDKRKKGQLRGSPSKTPKRPSWVPQSKVNFRDQL